MTPLKYTITARLNKLTRAEHEAVMKQILQAIAPSARNTFYMWRQTKQEDSFEIPFTKQQAIARVLGCTVDELQASSEDTDPADN